ncbi:hypothetical protein BGX29_007329 [Mortierella sp. GBA35]|nr:hypothetical protein BGX29_007329 [Mortierella sp. GBA35]
MDNKAAAAASGTKKRAKKPSKAPLRMLKKRLRTLERLLKNSSSDNNQGTAKDLPPEVIAKTEMEIIAVKKQIEAAAPQSAAKTEAATGKNAKKSSQDAVAKKGIKITELRRAGRKVVAFKKQHPNHETNEEESKALVELELDLLYIKSFPKDQEYISVYDESVEQDEEKVKARTEIRENTRQKLESGEIKRSTGGVKSEETTMSVSGMQPASNWSDDDEEEEDQDEDAEDESDDEEEEEERAVKKSKKE